MLFRSKLSISSSRIDHASSQYLLNSDQVRFEKIKIAGMHGQAEGSLIIRSPFQTRRYEADFKLADIGLLDLSLIARLEKARFTGSIRGALKASWMDHWKNFAGEGHLMIAPIAGEEAAHELTSKILPLSRSEERRVGKECRL